MADRNHAVSDGSVAAETVFWNSDHTVLTPDTTPVRGGAPADLGAAGLRATGDGHNVQVAGVIERFDRGGGPKIDWIPRVTKLKEHFLLRK